MMASSTDDAVARVAVIIPCLNEQESIGKVVADFRRVLQDAQVIVVDNGSTDETAARARAAGARVVAETRRGKGFALQCGFEASRGARFVLMVDGDDTYPAEDAPRLLQSLEAGADMAIGTRLLTREPGAFTASHSLGNRLFILLVRLLFGARTDDLFSGYRAFSRRFLDVSPLVTPGFEVETELSMQALAHGFRVAEVPVAYRSRPRNSASKLSTFRDGYRILIALVAFLRDYRPLTFFGIVGVGFFGLSLVAGWPVLSEYSRTGFVSRLPLAVLATGLALLGALAMVGGVILSSISRRSAELAALMVRRSTGGAP